MTTNQTIDGVPREDFTCISQAARAMAATTGTPGWGSAVKCFTMHCTPFVVIRMADEIEKLRALLDAEPAPCAKSQVEPAAQAQGVPVARWVDEFDAEYRLCPVVGNLQIQIREAGKPDKWVDVSMTPAHALTHLSPLYAEQPAPVAVVLTERREPKHYWPRFGKLTATARVAAEEWNACIDEVTRLNTKE